MKKQLFIITFFVLWLLPGVAGVKDAGATPFALQKYMAYSVGEKLEYLIHYGFVDAGVATLEVKEKMFLNGTEVYKVVGTGKTVGMTDWFFRTRDRYETYINKRTLLPEKFIRDVDEGGYIIKRDIDFNRTTNTAKDNELKKDTNFAVPANVQDIFSAFYYARCLDVSAIAKGDIIEIPTFLDHEIFMFRIRFVGREVVNTKKGKIVALKFVPVLQEGRVFKDEDDLNIWISDDDNHVPVRIQSELVVGSIKVDLVNYSGLRHPLNFKK